MNLESKRWWNWLDQPIEELKEVLEELSLTFQGQTLSWVVANMKNPLKFILNIGNSRILFFYKTIYKKSVGNNFPQACWRHIIILKIINLLYNIKKFFEVQYLSCMKLNKFKRSWDLVLPWERDDEERKGGRHCSEFQLIVKND